MKSILYLLTTYCDDDILSMKNVHEIILAI